MAKADKDATVHSHIEKLVKEEHKLFERGDLSKDEAKRLADVQAQLDQCWDLLRQRRALRESGLDPEAAASRPPEVVERYQQ